MAWSHAVAEFGAWTEGIAEKSYFDFDYIARKRASAKTMRYLRLWCFDDLQRQTAAEDIMQNQAESGIEVKALHSRKLQDMSLIWVPKDGVPVESTRDLSTQDLFNHLVDGRTFKALCGIEFAARGGKELDAMTLYGPGHDEFRKMFDSFVSNWAAAKPVRSGTKQS